MPRNTTTPRKTPSNRLTYLIVAAILGLILIIGLLPDRGSSSVSLNKAPETVQTLPPRTAAPTTEPTSTPSPSPTAAPTDRGTPTPAPAIIPAVIPTARVTSSLAPTPTVLTYVLNTNTRRFHLPDCSSVRSIKDKNRGSFTGTREEIIEQGYKPCGNCHP